MTTENKKSLAPLLVHNRRVEIDLDDDGSASVVLRGLHGSEVRGLLRKAGAAVHESGSDGSRKGVSEAGEKISIERRVDGARVTVTLPHTPDIEQ